MAHGDMLFAKIFAKIFQRKQLPRSLFDRYNVIYPTTRPRTPSATLFNNNNMQNALTDAYGAPSPKEVKSQ